MEKRIYIIGAGFAGQTIADDIKRKKIFGKVKPKDNAKQMLKALE